MRNIIWPDGSSLRCVHPRAGVTKNRVYKLIHDYAPLTHRAENTVMIFDDYGIQMEYYVSRFIRVDHKEFTDEEYERLLV